MKTILIMLFIVSLASASGAQTFGEWFQQNKTQKKYLAEQIAALKVYSGYLKKGYDVAKSGLGTIGEIKNGDFGLHSIHFNSLKAVSPEVTKYPRVIDIINTQENIRKLITDSKDWVQNSGLLTEKEKDYIRRVYSRLDDDCLSSLEEMEAVTTPGKLEMSDDERIQRIDRIFKDSQGQYAFAKSFSTELQVMIKRKGAQQEDLKTARKLYGIK